MKHEFYNFNKEKLAYDFVSSSSKTLVIMVHGFLGIKDWYVFKELEKSIISIKIDSFKFDFSGNGKSEGMFFDSTVSKEVKELTQILKYFKKKYERIIVIAHSMGCAVSLITTKNPKLISCLILMNPLVLPSISFKDSILKFSPYVFLEKLHHVKTRSILQKIKILSPAEIYVKKIIEEKVVGHEFLKELPKIDVIDYAEKLSIPILIIHGKKDQIIPYSHVEYLYNNLGSKEKKLVLLDYTHKPKKQQMVLIKFEIFKFLKSLKEKFLK
jgi:pimeloyl-ACP methyl ester carboxylesterase